MQIKSGRSPPSAQSRVLYIARTLWPTEARGTDLPSRTLSSSLPEYLAAQSIYPWHFGIRNLISPRPHTPSHGFRPNGDITLAVLARPTTVDGWCFRALFISFPSWSFSFTFTGHHRE